MANGEQGCLVTEFGELNKTKLRSLKNSKGKSGREKSLMIKEKNLQITKLKKRIKELLAKLKVERTEKNSRLTKELANQKINELRTDKNKVLRNQRIKTKVRENRLEELIQLVKDLKTEVSVKDKRLVYLERRIEHFKNTINKVRGAKRRKKYIKLEPKLSVEARRLKSIAENGIDVASYNVYVNTFRLVNFSKQNNLTVDLLSVMLQIDLEGSVITQQLKCGTRQTLNKGVKLGLLAIQQVKATKSYYLTVKGKEIVLNLKKYIKRRKDL